ncbi:hypothetical protein FCL47_23245 [Desulfopila sp. IMCC35006]|uniref:hypothetical protein n=1 Tax=Desulfopila sp. IMCC35006 TaxID=2569542 RepID=UPI0010AD5504|nr:hypothetical protein [Desulfopila sp. IMCC35006]TKB23277.1 hypothetical protein FCL47_23245 [Desulfopila sp. IMCC35006]
MSYVQSSFLSNILCFLLMFALQPGSVLAQNKMSAEEEAIYKSMIKSSGNDPEMVEEAMKQTEFARNWTEGKDGIVYYHIVGVYAGQTNVVGGSNWIGYADVTDRVEIDLQWMLSESKMVGTPTIQNSKSEVRNPRNPEPSCSPPVIKGAYEHYELQGIKPGLSGTLELQVQTSYPVVEVAQFCTGSRKSVPASSKTRPEVLAVPSPVMLAMSLPDSDELRISPDKNSLIHKKGGWTWTFTPSIKE